jgi:hypothetical protein
MPASKIGSGVTKSGSPMPKEITFSIVAAMSKNFRIPDGGVFATLSAMNLFTDTSYIGGRCDGPASSSESRLALSRFNAGVVADEELQGAARYLRIPRR